MRALSILLAAVAVTCAAAFVPPSVIAGSGRTAAALTIDARVKADGFGSFRSTGGLSDSGTVAVTRYRSGDVLRLKEVFEGTEGSFTLAVVHSCKSGKSTWKVVDGSSSYESLRGTGTATGAAPVCAGKRAFHGVYRGSVGGVTKAAAGVTTTASPPAPPPPPPPPPPPTTPTTTTPPAPTVPQGTYCGFSDEGRGICVDVGMGGRFVTGFKTQSQVNCRPNSAWYITITLTSTSILIRPDLTFSYTFEGALGGSGAQATYTLGGTFDTSGNVTGTLGLTRYSFTNSGTQYECSGAPFRFTAKLGA